MVVNNSYYIKHSIMNAHRVALNHIDIIGGDMVVTQSLYSTQSNSMEAYHLKRIDMISGGEKYI